MISYELICLLLLLSAGIYYLSDFVLRKGKLPLPPGPIPIPFIGNILDFPPPGQQEWMHWIKHKDRYGPISSVSLLGQTLILINDSQLAFELMEKRSSFHSSRPTMVFAGEMVGWEHSLSGQKYSGQFRAYRKSVAKIFNSSASVAQFNTLQDVEIRRFLLRLLQKPDQLIGHIRTEAGAIILKIAYDYTIEAHSSDPLIGLADQALAQFSNAAVPGAWIVDIIPPLRYLPEWFPGTGFKQTARSWKATLDQLANKPYAFVKQQMKLGETNNSYVANLLATENSSPEEDFVIKWSAASLYAGGADTTVSSLSCFFLAMTLFPEVQYKAQEEIDRVTDSKRLPNFSDRNKLPYVDAIVKEVLRWHPIAPMGLPHMTTQDDVCNGYRIPKGALLIPNIWAFTHDSSSYHDPMVFKPERFLSNPPEPDPHNLAFGFGRRICPGRLLADANVYLNIAQSLAVFRIIKKMENGREVEPVVYFNPGIISHPKSFDTNITPRSKVHEALIRSIEVEHPWEPSDAAALETLG